MEVLGIEESRKLGRGGEGKVQGGTIAKRRKLDNGEVAWGEKLSTAEKERQAFLKAEATSQPGTGIKQTQISVMTGLEWEAYVLGKELIEESVDRAWAMDEVASWTEGDMPVPGSTGGQYVIPGREIERGPLATTVSVKKAKGGIVSGPTQPVMGGQGIKVTGGCQESKIKTKRGKGLPGVSANQKSIAEYFERTKCAKKHEWVGTPLEGGEGGRNKMTTLPVNEENNRICTVISRAEMTRSGDMMNARKNSLHQRKILYQSNSDNTSNGICDGPSGMDDMRSLSESGASVRVVKTDMEKGGVPRVTKLSQENNSRILQKGGEGRDNSDLLVKGGEGCTDCFKTT